MGLYIGLCFLLSAFLKHIFLVGTVLTLTDWTLQVSYMILQRVSPVTHSVGNCVKRVVVIVSSVLFFKTPVSPINTLGNLLAWSLAEKKRFTLFGISFILLQPFLSIHRDIFVLDLLQALELLFLESSCIHRWSALSQRRLEILWRNFCS